MDLGSLESWVNQTDGNLCLCVPSNQQQLQSPGLSLPQNRGSINTYLMSLPHQGEPWPFSRAQSQEGEDKWGVWKWGTPGDSRGEEMAPEWNHTTVSKLKPGGRVLMELGLSRGSLRQHQKPALCVLWMLSVSSRTARWDSDLEKQRDRTGLLARASNPRKQEVSQEPQTRHRHPQVWITGM